MKLGIFLICLSMFVSCNVDYSPGNLKDLPYFEIQGLNSSHFKKYQNSSMIQSDSSGLFEMAQQEMENIGQTGKFLLYFCDTICEYIIVQPAGLKDEKIYIFNGAYIDVDGYSIIWEGDELSQNELSHIEKRIESIII